MRATCSGVAIKKLCPIVTDNVSPGHHRSPFSCNFHARDGTTPVRSGKIIPVDDPNPNLVA